jgi:hypothetical protein
MLYQWKRIDHPILQSTPACMVVQRKISSNQLDLYQWKTLSIFSSEYIGMHENAKKDITKLIFLELYIMKNRWHSLSNGVNRA